MPTGLNVNDVVATSISLTAVPAGFRNFGACMVIGPSDVIDIVERRRQYADIGEVASDFGTAAPEYQFASLFFAQNPQPDLLYIGRFAQTATSARLNGAGLTPAQRLLASFNAVTAGAMLLSVDGVPYALTGLDFSQAVNLNGVASVVEAALVNAGAAGATVVWDAENFRFTVESGSAGPASALSYAAAPTAIDAVTFPSNPAANATVTINGTAVTFVAANPTGTQVLIGSSLAATLQNLLTVLRSSSDAQIVKFRFALIGSTLYPIAANPGTAGNALTVAASAATVRSATLQGGSGIDVSVLLGLSILPTSAGANADAPIPGIAAESLSSAVSTFDTLYGDWYALSVASNVAPADSDHLAAAAYIEAAGRSRVYGITTQNTEALDDTRTDDLPSLLQSAGYSRTMVAFSSTSLFAVASLFGRFATINYQGSDTTITLKFKQMPGVMPEYLTETQAATLDAKDVNYFAAYQNGVSILQQGVMSSGIFIDSRINADWLANYVQTNLFNLLYTEPKLPQTDQGMGLMKANMTASLQQGVVNGYLAPGVWNGPSFGTLNTGDFLPLGFYIYAPLVASQPENDRAKRKSVLFQIGGKEAGAVHFAPVQITINQ